MMRALRNTWPQGAFLLALAAGTAEPGRAQPTQLAAQVRALNQQAQRRADLREFDAAALPLYNRAWRLAQAAHNDTLVGRHAYHAGRSYYNLVRLDSAVFLLRLSWQASWRAQDLAQVISAGNFLMLTYGDQGRPDSVRAMLSRLRALYPRTRPRTEARARLDNVLAGHYQDQGNYARALDYRLAQLAYERQTHDTVGTSVALTNIGELFYLQGQSRQAIRYKLDGLRLAEQTPAMRTTLPQLHAMLGKTYLEAGLPDSARLHYEAGLRQLGSAPDPAASAYLHAELSSVLTRQGKLALARQHSQQAVAAVANSEDLDTKTTVYFYAGEVELKARNYAAARRYLRQSYDLALRVQNKDRYEAITRLLAEAEAGTGHYAEAYRLRSYSAALLDSAHVGEGQRAMAAMEARYQNQDKQRQIQLLKLETQARAAEATRQRRATYWALAGVGGLLLLLGLIGYLLRQRQRTATLLAQQNARLAEANQTKAQLFSIISHDLRAPVSSLFQMLEIMLDAPDLLDEEARNAQVVHLRQTSRDLLATMDELLVWSKNQLDRLDLVGENVALPVLLAELHALYAPLAQQKHLDLQISCPPNLHRRTDPNFLRVILRNLLQNAVKFTPPGGQVRLDAEAGPGAAVTLRVRDTGPGMAASQLEQMLNAPASSSAHGLGLRLTQEFVRRLGGTLRAESVPGAGSVFAVVV
ncbi:tetratricopeptide repeat protein [Hymenobacter sp. BT186]|uniref:histidine kinase n=1 Tax=Hymenobacter telluris TaxID=2816474 RepID=A0A939EV87_9BACT|nr:HAMP domain-containing sensor histidine kinase [Hymenobacter telluris]MBO0357621.1 tetratricopeptide repeat protein [Hymenobacter telluris]MBW3373647.1 tetratricopeptide repeat protein [Hymenobacter norwichensis]